jgi:hypothetical protein
MEWYLVVIITVGSICVLGMAAYVMRDQRPSEARDKAFVWAFRERKIKGGAKCQKYR